jgi:CheY-like chemotaxis protein
MNAKMNILIADDDMFNMMLAKAMIGNMVPNATIYEAVNGKIAYDLTQKHKFDLIFMDVQMPEMDGNDATKAIRSYELLNKMHTPIVGLTAGALKEEKEKCMEAGMNEFLTKPIDTVKLKNVISNYLWVNN